MPIIHCFEILDLQDQKLGREIWDTWPKSFFSELIKFCKLEVTSLLFFQLIEHVMKITTESFLKLIRQNRFAK